MNRTLIDVLFASEKRKNMLLMLSDGPLEMTCLLDVLNTSRQALLPQAKVLEDYNLISKNDDVCELTTIGRIVVDRMMPAIGNLGVLDKDVDYWGTHCLDFIPEYLLRRLDELDSYAIIEPNISNAFELNKDFMEASKRSQSVNSFISFLHPDHLQMFLALLDRDVDASFISSPTLFEKLRSDYNVEIQKLMSSGSVKFFIYNGRMDVVSFSQNDYGFVLRMLTKNNEYDSKQLVCNSPVALKWGNELFEYYKQRSMPVGAI